MANLQEELLKLLEQLGSLSISQLAAQLYASESTIRREVAKLEKQNMVARSNASVLLLNKEQGVSLAYSLKTHIKEKHIIAQRAAELVQDRSTVFLASASTTYFMIPLLAQKHEILIITDGLRHALKAAECRIKTICLGGAVAPNSPFASGLFAEDMLSQLHADTFFFSVPHVSRDGKLWHYSTEKLRILQLMMQNSFQSILLCNSQKVGDKTGSYLFCGTDSLDVIISEAPLAADLPLKKNAVTICSD